jgi:hypothetical protein
MMVSATCINDDDLPLKLAQAAIKHDGCAHNDA